jgi:Tol biopolymer transport system component
MKIRLQLATAMLAVLLGGACTDMKTIVAPVEQLQISGSRGAIMVGDAQQISATALFQGRNLSGRSISWSSSNTAVATVDGSGKVQGVSAGAATITATAEGVTASVQIEVRNPVPSVRSLSPTAVISKTEAFTLTVEGSGFVTTSVVRWNGSERRTTFVSATQLRADITAADVASAGTAQVTVFSPTPGGGSSQALAFTITAPDPTRIAFASSRAGNSEIFIMNSSGSSVQQITNDAGIDERPSWSPDGRQLAFQSNRTGNYEIYVMNADGSGLRQLTSNSAIDAEPAWSPDGTKIAFHTNRNGNWDLYVVNVDGSGLRPLITTSTNERQPNWSPNGSMIAFISDQPGPYQIYTANADGTGTRRLTFQLGGDAEPRWSPDGKRIAFYSNRDGNFEVYLINPDGTGLFRLTKNVDEDQHPSWSPDGQRIAFESDRDGNREIYVMNADGSGVTRITNFAGFDWMPSWGKVPTGSLSASRVW